MNPIDRILELTGQVQEHINNGDWAGACGLDAERQQLIVSVLDDAGADGLSAEAREVLRDVQARNQDAIESVRSQKRQLAADYGELKANVTAIHSYQKNIGTRRPAAVEPVTQEAPE